MKLFDAFGFEKTTCRCGLSVEAIHISVLDRDVPGPVGNLSFAAFDPDQDRGPPESVEPGLCCLMTALLHVPTVLRAQLERDLDQARRAAKSYENEAECIAKDIDQFESEMKGMTK